MNKPMEFRRKNLIIDINMLQSELKNIISYTSWCRYIWENRIVRTFERIDINMF